MKSTFIAMLSMMAATLISCNVIQPDPFTDNTGARQPGIDKTLIEHTWAFHSFWDAGTDATSELSGYFLEFREDGSVKAGNGRSGITGQWHSEHRSSKVMLEVRFEGDGVWSDLSQMWEITHYPFREDNMFKMEHIVTDKRDSYYLELEAL